jgi:radical SAM-linked protein
LKYTQGFHPGPRIQIACALPLGFIGCAEVVDLWLDVPVEAPLDVSQAGDRLQSAAPPGLTILRTEQVDDQSPALQTQMAAAEYNVTLLESVPGDCPEPFEGLDARVSGVLEAGSLLRERRGKTYDLRPLILSLEHRTASLKMILSAREGATGRPEEVLAVMGIPSSNIRVERTRLIFKDGGNSSPELKIQ